MKDNFSPEEKLLRLIRGNKKTAPVPIQQVNKTGQADKQINTPVTKAIKKPITYAFMQRSVFTLLGISFICLIASLIYPKAALRRTPLVTVIPGNPKADSLLLEKEEIVPLEDYLKEIGGRQIFMAQHNSPLAISSQAMETESIQDINLVGIISGENPQAVIEDKKAQKTYYVNKGQFIGNFQLEEIREGKIILNLQGKRYELTI